MTGINKNAEDITVLSKLNAQFIRNFTDQDTAGHDLILHPDFICIDNSGEIMGREEYLKDWATAYDNSGYTSFSYGEEYIRIWGNVALIRSRTTYTKLINEKLVQGNTVYTDTYFKENGKWLCIQAQITPIQSP